jgi:hypothetical protein
MSSSTASIEAAALQKPAIPSFVLLPPKETAQRLKVSTSWLAKARMRGDGPRQIHSILRSHAHPMDERTAAAVDERVISVGCSAQHQFFSRS